MATPDTRSGRNYMKTGPGMYAFACLLYTSDAADEEDSVDLGGRRRIKKKKVSRTLAKQ